MELKSVEKSAAEMSSRVVAPLLRRDRAPRLATEAVEGAALPLEGIDDVERRDRLALGVLSVGNSVTDDTLKEGLEDTTGLLVDHCRVDALARVAY